MNLDLYTFFKSGCQVQIDLREFTLIGSVVCITAELQGRAGVGGKQ